MTPERLLQLQIKATGRGLFATDCQELFDHIDELRAELAAATEAVEKYHDIMQALRNARGGHGDCKSGDRYGGVPKACRACMANLKIDKMLSEYKGRTVRLA